MFSGKGCDVSGDIERLVRLRAKLQAAERELVRATLEELPVGTVIRATLGGHRITATVTGHYSTCFAYCGSVFVRNVLTGAERRVTPHYDGHAVEVVSDVGEHGSSKAKRKEAPMDPVPTAVTAVVA
jgi:hypothetical protein